MCKLVSLLLLFFFSFTTWANVQISKSDSSKNEYLVGITTKMSFTKKDLNKIWKEAHIPKFVMPIKFGFDVVDIPTEQNGTMARQLSLQDWFLFRKSTANLYLLN